MNIRIIFCLLLLLVAVPFGFAQDVPVPEAPPPAETAAPTEPVSDVFSPTGVTPATLDATSFSSEDFWNNEALGPLLISPAFWGSLLSNPAKLGELTTNIPEGKEDQVYNGLAAAMNPDAAERILGDQFDSDAEKAEPVEGGIDITSLDGQVGTQALSRAWNVNVASFSNEFDQGELKLEGGNIQVYKENEAGELEAFGNPVNIGTFFSENSVDITSATFAVDVTADGKVHIDVIEQQPLTTTTEDGEEVEIEGPQLPNTVNLDSLTGEVTVNVYQDNELEGSPTASLQINGVDVLLSEGTIKQDADGTWFVPPESTLKVELLSAQQSEEYSSAKITTSDSPVYLGEIESHSFVSFDSALVDGASENFVVFSKQGTDEFDVEVIPKHGVTGRPILVQLKGEGESLGRISALTDRAFIENHKGGKTHINGWEIYPDGNVIVSHNADKSKLPSLDINIGDKYVGVFNVNQDGSIAEHIFLGKNADEGEYLFTLNQGDSVEEIKTKMNELNWGDTEQSAFLQTRYGLSGEDAAAVVSGEGIMSGPRSDGTIEISGSTVDGESLRNYMIDKLRGSKFDGFVPEDGDKYGIVEGTPEEWATLFTLLAYRESSWKTSTSDGTRSIGIWQIGRINGQSSAYNPDGNGNSFSEAQLRDPEESTDIALRIFETNIFSNYNEQTDKYDPVELSKVTIGDVDGNGRWDGLSAFFGPFRSTAWTPEQTVNKYLQSEYAQWSESDSNLPPSSLALFNTKLQSTSAVPPRLFAAAPTSSPDFNVNLADAPSGISYKYIRGNTDVYEDVKEIQRVVYAAQIAALDRNDPQYQAKYDAMIDGIYGADTRQKVWNWQVASGLNPDGIFGKDSYAAVTGVEFDYTAARIAKANRNPQTVSKGIPQVNSQYSHQQINTQAFSASSNPVSIDQMSRPFNSNGLLGDDHIYLQPGLSVDSTDLNIVKSSQRSHLGCGRLARSCAFGATYSAMGDAWNQPDALLSTHGGSNVNTISDLDRGDFVFFSRPGGDASNDWVGSDRQPKSDFHKDTTHVARVVQNNNGKIVIAHQFGSKTFVETLDNFIGRYPNYKPLQGISTE